jgi:hypothetical protein
MARAKRSGGDGGVSTRRGASGGGGPWLLLLAGLGCGCAVDLGVDGVGVDCAATGARRYTARQPHHEQRAEQAPPRTLPTKGEDSPGRYVRVR